MANTVEHGPTYRYIEKLLTALNKSQQQSQQFQQQSQQLQQQFQQLQQQSQQLQQQYLNYLRASAASMAKHVLKMCKRNVYSGYDDALSDYLSEIEPSDDFRNEAIQIFNSIWNQNNPDTVV